MQEAYAKYYSEFCVGVFGLSAKTYNRNHLLDTAVTPESADRLWWFQVCTEVAYFQVAPANDSIRSHQVNTEYTSYMHNSYFFIIIYLSAKNSWLLSIDIIWTYARVCLGKVFTLKWMQQTCTTEVIELLVCNTDKLLIPLLTLCKFQQFLHIFALQRPRLSSQMGHRIHGVMHPNRLHLLTVSLHLL